MNSVVTTLQNGDSMTGTTKPPPSNAGKNTMGKDDFMKLLLTQLSAQDPLNPQDSTAFVAQLTQFANLEGIQNLGNKMDSLVSITGANNSANAVSLLGKDVRLNGNKIGGNGTVYYQLPQQAQTCALEVRDEKGIVVKTVSGLPTDPSLHQVNVTDLAPGSYTFDIQAYDTAGKEIQASTSVADRVKGVSFANNAPVLLMNSGTQMNASDVVEIRQPDATAQ